MFLGNMGGLVGIVHRTDAPVGSFKGAEVGLAGGRVVAEGDAVVRANSGRIDILNLLNEIATRASQHAGILEILKT